MKIKFGPKFSCLQALKVIHCGVTKRLVNECVAVFIELVSKQVVTVLCVGSDCLTDWP